jgi:ribosomal subunit interface protein
VELVKVIVEIPVSPKRDDWLGQVSHVSLTHRERAEVHFSEERNPRIPNCECCEVIMSGHGRVIRAHASASDPLVAVDFVVEKLENQLAKTKGRIVGRPHPSRRGQVQTVRARIRTA